jgi:hypothetical protein
MSGLGLALVWAMLTGLTWAPTTDQLMAMTWVRAKVLA